MDALKLKEDILAIKGRLDRVESDLSRQIEELSLKDAKWQSLDARAAQMVATQNSTVTFNICGKKLVTKVSTLLSTKDTLFYKLLLSPDFDITDEVFFDRDVKSFEVILDFLRTKKLNLKRLGAREKDKVREEAKHFEVGAVIDLLGEGREVELESFEFSGAFLSSGVQVGTNRVEDLSDRSDLSMMKGICTNSPGWIQFTLSRDASLDGLDIGGFRGNTAFWAAVNGATASIKLSTDKSNWTTVGTIPSGYGTAVKTVKFSRTEARYIRFDCTSFLGIGYLKLHTL